MQNLISLLPIVFLLFFYLALAVLHAAYIKVSADLLRGMRVYWRDAFRIAVGLMALIQIVRSVALGMGLSIATATLIIFSLALHLSVGGWYLGVRAVTQQNEPAGWKRGILVSALAYVFLVVTIVIANMVNK